MDRKGHVQQVANQLNIKVHHAFQYNTIHLLPSFRMIDTSKDHIHVCL